MMAAKLCQRVVMQNTNGFVQPPPAKRQRVGVMEKKEALALRKKHISPSFTLHYSKVNPLKIVYGRGQYLYDEHDQPYLDCINNVTHVGHCHPRVVQAGVEQMARLSDLPDSHIIEKYTRHLLSTFPDNMGHVFYVHSGTEANDLALRIAEAVTEHTEVIAIDGAYHGHSKSLMGLSSYKMKQEKDGVSRITPNPHSWISTLPDSYRGKFTNRDTAGEKYAGEVKDIIDKMEQQGKKLASFMCESFPGCAGQVQLPAGYLKAVFEHVHRAGGISIIDEVQTGFGRGGEYFWLFQSQGVQPDVVTVGKPMGNGHPISAVVTTKQIARDYLAKCPDTNSKYVGDPVSLAIAESVLCVLEEEKLTAHAQELGDYIMTQLRQMAESHPCIGDVRGYGMFIGIELVEGGDQSKTPNGELAEQVIERLMKEHRIMIMNDGLENNVLKIKPPLCFTRDNAELVLTTLEQTLTLLGY